MSSIEQVSPSQSSGVDQQKSGSFVWSIHDVMPSTLEAVSDTLDLLEASGIGDIKLLVVPGLDWSEADLVKLREWQDRGLELVAHGWHHKAREIKGWRHRLHSLLISRDVAEHLCLSGREIRALIRDSHRWFGEHDLTPPRLYVPPAWALGSINLMDLKLLPVERVEILGGTMHCSAGRLEPELLIGFEADTTLRALALGLWNRLVLWRASSANRKLRVAIHPNDLSLKLAGSLRSLVAAAAANG